jgi:hypothetical protein
MAAVGDGFHNRQPNATAVTTVEGTLYRAISYSQDILTCVD